MAHENATPRPWVIDASLPDFIRGADDAMVAMVLDIDGAIETANAALICKSVNAYDTLRAERDALREEVETLTLATDLGSSAIEALTAERNDLLSAIRAVSEADDIGSMHAAFRICQRLIDKSEAQS